jgi:HD-like signal output (HDOD) protein
MIFQGDLSKYHPADALMFLANLNLNGLFSVSCADSILTLSFKNGMLIDAHSPRGDRKLLQFLRFRAIIDEHQERQITRIHTETGLSVRQILSKLNSLSLAAIQAPLLQAMMEVILELFLLECGTFNFTDTEVEEDSAGIRLETDKVSLKALVMSDELREFVKTHKSLAREMDVCESHSTELKHAPGDELIIKMASRRVTVRRLLDETPLAGSHLLKRLEEMIARGVILLREPQHEPDGAIVQPDPLFSAYKQALRKLFSARDAVARLSAVISFCKGFYDGMLILTARQGEVIQCKLVTKNAAGTLVQKVFSSGLGRLADDPVLAAVSRSGVGFFGQRFPSTLIDQTIGSTGGDCALIPVLNHSGTAILFFAYSAGKFSGLSPHHYLELLSWMMAPTSRMTPAEASPCAETTHLPDGATPAVAQRAHESDSAAGNRMAELIARIDDLPPLPALAARALAMLSNPDTPMDEIEAAIGQDQALTTKLIKVANSALYSGYQKANTLRQVLTRIGVKTTRSLILTSSTRSYFLKNRQGMKIWGRFLWQHAVECGLGARRIAAAVSYPDPDEAFTGGIVHDVGKLIILMLFPEKYKEIEKIRKMEKIWDKDAEQQVIGADHEQIGRLLMDKWKMPDAIKACTEFHHRCQSSGEFRTLTAIVAYANRLSQIHGANPRTKTPEDDHHLAELTAWLGINAATQSEIISAVMSDFQNTDLMS